MASSPHATFRNRFWRRIPLLAPTLLLATPLAEAAPDGHPDLSAWRQAHFDDPHGTGPGADFRDPDRDGRPNLVEYALGLDPLTPDKSGAPQLSAQGNTLQLAFNRERTDVKYYVERSADFIIWEPIAIDQEGDVLGPVTATATLDSATFAVLRLRVVNPNAVVPLYDADTVLEPATTIDAPEALYTYFADRARDRHAREDHFEAYDHYLSFYWEHRTAMVEIIDPIGKGGDTITFNVTSLWRFKQDQAELRFFYRGINTVAEYHNNGSMDRIDDTHYTRSVNWNPKEKRPLQVGDRLEFELSQFLDSPPNGRENYYGTTYLYIVGQGLVPWETRGVFGDPDTEREDSYPIPEAAWLGGQTTLHRMLSGEPDNHFMQMATNLAPVNGQPFVRGRRVHHTDFGDGSHNEGSDNPDFPELAGLLGPRYMNRSCVACHDQNGRALPPAIGVALKNYVVQTRGPDGQPHPDLGRALQPRATGNNDPEPAIAIVEWVEENGLRRPVYEFDGITPAQFSARVAPQLVGMGLLEAIPESEILARADPNDADGDGVSGRAHLVADPETGEPRLGRFGWKAAQPSVRTQVAAAFNNDMGVTTSVYPELDRGTNQPAPPKATPELAEEHLRDLTAYVSLLGVRPQRDHENPQVMRGQELFTQMNCVACHVPAFTTTEFHPHAELRGQAIQPYTDLLLHDMGPGLADTASEGDANGSEWRTPPLWGIGLTAGVSGGEAYLHDGRARTLDEAIRWHGGEANSARAAYEALSDTDRAAVVAFLQSL